MVYDINHRYLLIGLQHQVRKKSEANKDYCQVHISSFQYSIREVNSIALLLSQVVDEKSKVVDLMRQHQH